MSAIKLHRRSRMIRFGLMGVLSVIGVIIGLLLVTNIGLLISSEPLYPKSMRDAQTLLEFTAILSGSFGLFGAVIGASTARLTGRILGWKIFGAVIIAGSVFMAASTFLWIDFYPLGHVIALIMCAMGIVSGVLMIYEARKTAID